jgi:hypothetical protein
MNKPILVAFAILVAIAGIAPDVLATERACRPSLSNLWKCPDTSVSPKRIARKAERACRPSLSNGFKCPGTHVTEAPTRNRPTASDDSRRAIPRRTATQGDRTCRPSLSNGFKCPARTGVNQYRTEAQAKARCAGDTVVWANTQSKIYHFEGTWNYGKTRHGAYMCEGDSLSAGMRAAKNEVHP